MAVGVSLVVFGLVHLSGDPVLLMVSSDAPADVIATTRHELGFDRPLHAQFTDYVARAARGDLGVAVPIFWLALLLIAFFGVYLRWFPVFGRGSLAHLVLPAVSLSTVILGRLARLVRGSMLEVLGQDYVRTARAKGVGEVRVLAGHALKNAAIPIVTLLGLQFAQLLGGAVVTETIFAWLGIGRLVVEAIFNRDFPVVQGVVLVVSLIFVAVNLLVDLAYAALDPHIRTEAA